MIVLDTIVLSTIVIAVVQAIKMAFQIKSNWIPLTDIALAIAIGGAASFFGLTTLSILDALVAGCMAAGLWDLGKGTTNGTINALK